MNEVAKTSMVDGFEGYEDRFEGGELQRASAGRVIQGDIIKFTNEATWITKDDAEMAPDRELIVVDIVRCVQRWKDEQPIEIIILESGQKFPDIPKLNEDVPRSEWVKGPDGQLRGPYQKQQILYLLDPQTLDRFCWPSGTVGGDIAIRELVDKTKWMRKFRGAYCYPIVTLSDKFLNTRYGGRQRPHLVITRWTSLDAGGNSVTVQIPPALDSGAAEKAESSPGMKTVAGPSLAEQMGDEVPWNDSPDINVPKASSPQAPEAVVQKPTINKRGAQKIAASRGR
jgi:hypothetical protein